MTTNRNEIEMVPGKRKTTLQNTLALLKKLRIKCFVQKFLKKNQILFNFKLYLKKEKKSHKNPSRVFNPRWV